MEPPCPEGIFLHAAGGEGNLGKCCFLHSIRVEFFFGGGIMAFEGAGLVWGWGWGRGMAEPQHSLHRALDSVCIWQLRNKKSIAMFWESVKWFVLSGQLCFLFTIQLQSCPPIPHTHLLPPPRPHSLILSLSCSSCAINLQFPSALSPLCSCQ